MKFNIVNPSDPYTMEAPDLEIAAVAGCFLGVGKYPLAGIGADSGEHVPGFMYGGHDEWFTEQFGSNFLETSERVIEQRGEELALALDSVTLQSESRSSMNDIKARAQDLSSAVRQKIASAATP